jgi:hypothetical protein
MCNGHRYRYESLDDPLEISNLDLYLLFPLQQTFRESTINITHIVFLTLESTRKDGFPIRKTSPIYDRILQSQGVYKRDTIERILARLTPVAQKVTGDNFTPKQEAGSGSYIGEINADGAVTGSTYTV